MENEQTTRKQRIDHQLARAGWGKGSLSFVEEFLISDSEIKDPTTPYLAADEFADYALPNATHRPLAIVEAKNLPETRWQVNARRPIMPIASRKSTALPERFAQEALGHNSKAVHRAYAKRALMKIPSLEDYEKRIAAKNETAA